jgi:hypothetical protein
MIAGVLSIAIIGLAIWYLARPEPLLVQGEAESTRIDIAARVSGRLGRGPWRSRPSTGHDCLPLDSLRASPSSTSDDLVFLRAAGGAARRLAHLKNQQARRTLG